MALRRLSNFRSSKSKSNPASDELKENRRLKQQIDKLRRHLEEHDRLHPQSSDQVLYSLGETSLVQVSKIIDNIIQQRLERNITLRSIRTETNILTSNESKESPSTDSQHTEAYIYHLGNQKNIYSHEKQNETAYSTSGCVPNQNSVVDTSSPMLKEVTQVTDKLRNQVTSNFSQQQDALLDLTNQGDRYASHAMKNQSHSSDHQKNEVAPVLRRWMHACAEVPSETNKISSRVRESSNQNEPAGIGIHNLARLTASDQDKTSWGKSKTINNGPDKTLTSATEQVSTTVVSSSQLLETKTSIPAKDNSDLPSRPAEAHHSQLQNPSKAIPSHVFERIMSRRVSTTHDISSRELIVGNTPGATKHDKQDPNTNCSTEKGVLPRPNPTEQAQENASLICNENALESKLNERSSSSFNSPRGHGNISDTSNDDAILAAMRQTNPKAFEEYCTKLDSQIVATQEYGQDELNLLPSNEYILAMVESGISENAEHRDEQGRRYFLDPSTNERVYCKEDFERTEKTNSGEQRRINMLLDLARRKKAAKERKRKAREIRTSS